MDLYFLMIVFIKLILVDGEEMKVLKSKSQNSWAEILNSSLEGLDEFTMCFRFYRDYFDIPGLKSHPSSPILTNILLFQMEIKWKKL